MYTKIEVNMLNNFKEKQQKLIVVAILWIRILNNVLS